MQKHMVREIVPEGAVLVRIKPTKIIAEKDTVKWE